MHTQTNGLGKNAAHLTIAKATMTIISLISGMLLSRFRTVAEYGTYSQLIIVITLATSLVMLGLPNSINYFLARAESREEKREFLSIYYTLNTLLCTAIGILLVAAIPLIEAYFNNPTIRNFWYFLALYPWARITISGISNVLVVYGKTKRLMLINILTALIALVSVLVIQAAGLTFREYIFAYLAGNLVISGWIHIQVYGLENGLSLCLKADVIRRIFAYSIPIGLASLVGTINIEMDKLMIGNLMGTEELAYYTNAGRELPLTMVAASLTAVLLPQMARKLKENRGGEAVSLWGRAIELSYIIICFFSAACIVFAPQIMTILYSEKYLPGVQIFRIYSLILLLRTTYFGLILNSVGKTRLILWSSVVSLGLNMVLNYVLFLWVGFEGPALASFLSILAVNVFQLVFTSRILGISFGKVFPWKRLGIISAVNAVWAFGAYGLVFVAKIGTDTRGIWLAIGLGCIIVICYIFFMWKRVGFLWRALNKVETSE